MHPSSGGYIWCRWSQAKTNSGPLHVTTVRLRKRCDILMRKGFDDGHKTVNALDKGYATCGQPNKISQMTETERGQSFWWTKITLCFHWRGHWDVFHEEMQSSIFTGTVEVPDPSASLSCKDSCSTIDCLEIPTSKEYSYSVIATPNPITSREKKHIEGVSIGIWPMISFLTSPVAVKSTALRRSTVGCCTRERSRSMEEHTWWPVDKCIGGS
jgi:hypothetical protein